MPMSEPDLAHLRQWVGRRHTDADTAALRHARLMAATVGLPPEMLQAGDALPPLWHWIYFLEGLPASQLGPDGHAARGGFLPPVPLPNRMWAGGRVVMEAPIPIGAAMEKRSQVQSVDLKQGRSGDLVFVTVLHEVFVGGSRCVREEHDIVYKHARPAGAPPQGEAAAEGDHQRPWQPDTTQLFRYSALTFNGHRIHYDADYCRAVEGYADPVVHGPLVATMLAGFAQEVAGRPLRSFTYRGLQPALLGAPLGLHLAAGGEKMLAWCRLGNGQACMRAEATFALN